ncbi:beta-carotene 15,15'-monooxygenase, partial [Halobacteriales archaeon SW_7_71_33]
MSVVEGLGFHTLRAERTETVAAEGTLPEWLTGTLLRNGPGAFETGATAVDHWFDGLAGLLRRLAGLLLSDGYDNTNVVVERVGDRYLALTETTRRVEVDPHTLETLGHVEYDGPRPSGHVACAHTKRDPATDAVVTFETEFGRRNHYHVYETTDPHERDHVASLPVERPAYMHSFALTPGYVVLTEFPFTVDPLDFFTPGAASFVDSFEWQPERGTRFRVVDRDTGRAVADARTEATFGFHHANAYERDGRLVVDLERLRAGEMDVFSGRLDRFTVDLDAERVDRERLYADGTALPTVSPARRCRPHRYVFAQSAEQPVTTWPRGVLKIDTETREVVEY